MRVGGSAWELKIDPKRPRKQIKQEKARRRRTTTTKRHNKRPRNTLTGIFQAKGVWSCAVLVSARRNARALSGDFSLLNKAYKALIRLLRQSPTRLCARKGRAVFNRFAHSAGPGREPQRVEAVGGDVDGLMQRSKGQVRSAI